MTLAGKTALVTGGTSGIGLATAEALADAGVKLVLAGRRADLLDGHAKRLPHTVVLAGEITDPAMPQRLVDLALEAHGRLDIVFNNAGQIHNGPIEEIDVDLVCQMVRVNVEAAFRMAYTALRHFRAAGSGHLVNTFSVLGLKTRIYSGAYAGTKFAIEAFTEALRMELAGSAIKITAVEPGLVVTDLHRDYAERPEKMINMAKPLSTQDVARAVLFALQQPDHVSVPQVMVLPQEQQF